MYCMPKAWEIVNNFNNSWFLFLFTHALKKEVGLSPFSPIPRASTGNKLEGGCSKSLVRNIAEGYCFCLV